MLVKLHICGFPYKEVQIPDNQMNSYTQSVGLEIGSHYRTFDDHPPNIENQYRTIRFEFQEIRRNGQTEVVANCNDPNLRRNMTNGSIYFVEEQQRQMIAQQNERIRQQQQQEEMARRLWTSPTPYGSTAANTSTSDSHYSSTYGNYDYERTLYPYTFPYSLPRPPPTPEALEKRLAEIEKKATEPEKEEFSRFDIMDML